MAINTFTFGGVTSSDFGIYVSGEGLFNAPKRSAEVVSIPGRNGAFIVDSGSFENIEVTYRVFNHEKDLADFRTKLADLRSALASQVGYQRLTDTFHPNEYRMGAFLDGVEVNPIKYNTASEFEIKFNCKPQRFLTSGETAISVTSGDTITNPTLFESHPMLEVSGSGEINIGNKKVVVNNVQIGKIVVRNSSSIVGFNNTFTVDTQFANIGDEITFEKISVIDTWTIGTTGKIIYNGQSYTSLALTNRVGSPDTPVTFNYGTARTETNTETYNMTVVHHGISEATSGTITLSVAYDGADTFTVTAQSLPPNYVGQNLNKTYEESDAILDSTQYTVGNPLYIDLDIGEAYKIEMGSIVSVNDSIQMPAELPALVSGANTITYDNTITQLDIVPRWWRV